MFFVRQGATHKVVIGPTVAVANGYVPVTTLALSTADEAEAILHDNGTVVDISGYTWAAITTADGYYHLTLQSGISNTVGHVTIVVNDDSLCLPVKAEFTVLEEAVYDALYAASANGFAGAAGASTVTFANTSIATVTNGVTLAAGAITDASLAGNMEIVFETDFASNYSAGSDRWLVQVAAINNGAITTNAINTGAITAAAFAAGAIDAAAIANGAIDAATFAADVDAEILSYLVDDATRIDASSLNTATVTTVPAILVDTAELQADWVNGGRLDLILDIIAADTTTDIPALIAALNNVSAANVLTQVNAALDTAISELGVAAPAATPTLRTGLMLLYMALRNKTVVQTSGTDALEIHNDAGTKIAAKLLTDAAGDYSEAKMA